MVYKVIERKKNGRMKTYASFHRIGKASTYRKKLILENMKKGDDYEG